MDEQNQPMVSPFDSEAIDAALIAKGYPADCVRWLCPKWRRHCHLIDTDHERHLCIWCTEGDADCECHREDVGRES